jgi:hypothetical protein
VDSQLPSLHLHFALSQYIFKKQNYCCTSTIASTLCLKPIYIEKAKLLLYFHYDKYNSYRLEILIWCNEDLGYVFVCQRRYCVLSCWQFSEVENTSRLENFLTWKIFQRINYFQKNDQHKSKTIRPNRLFCNSYVEPYCNPQLDSVEIQKRVELM